MTTKESVAQWMLEQFDSKKWLYQETVVYQIKKEFGDDFVYVNDNGNLAIDKGVLKEFRKITEGVAIWERGERAWRHLRKNEEYKGRQVE